MNAHMEAKFNEMFCKPAQPSKEETAAHYVGELKKLRKQQYDALIQCWNKRPELQDDAIVRLVAWKLNQNISDEAVQEFKTVIASFKQAAEARA